jgi:hypothetical protein
MAEPLKYQDPETRTRINTIKQKAAKPAAEPAPSGRVPPRTEQNLPPQNAGTASLVTPEERWNRIADAAY